MFQAIRRYETRSIRDRRYQLTVIDVPLTGPQETKHDRVGAFTSREIPKRVMKFSPAVMFRRVLGGIADDGSCGLVIQRQELEKGRSATDRWGKNAG